MELADKIFKRKTYDENKLIEYGFKKARNRFTFSVPILDGQFRLDITIDGGRIATDVIELAFDEPFTLYRIDGAEGAFVGQVRAEAEKALLDIADKCFYDETFKTRQAQMCIDYIQTKYGDGLEFLWQKFPDNAIWRRSDNNKWYGALLTVASEKLKLPSGEMKEVLDLRMNPAEKESLLNGKNILEGYHMNKNSWFSVVLDAGVPDAAVQEFIDKSFELAKKK